MLPFAGMSLLLLEAAGHIPPVSQGLEASVETPKRKCPWGAAWPRGAGPCCRSAAISWRRHQMKSTRLLIALSHATSKPMTPAAPPSQELFPLPIMMDAEDMRPFVWSVRISLSSSTFSKFRHFSREIGAGIPDPIRQSCRPRPQLQTPSTQLSRRKDRPGLPSDPRAHSQEVWAAAC